MTGSGQLATAPVGLGYALRPHPLKADMVFTAPTVTSTHARFPQ